MQKGVLHTDKHISDEHKSWHFSLNMNTLGPCLYFSQLWLWFAGVIFPAPSQSCDKVVINILHFQSWGLGLEPWQPPCFFDFLTVLPPPLTHRYSEDNGEVFGFLGVCEIEFYFALMNVHFRGEFQLHRGWQGVNLPPLHKLLENGWEKAV